MKQVVLASDNERKIREIHRIPAPLDIEVLPQAHFDRGNALGVRLLLPPASNTTSACCAASRGVPGCASPLASRASLLSFCSLRA